MIEQWTGEIVAKMHISGIKNRDLAKQLGVSAEWVSKVLNGKRHPKNAQRTFSEALEKLISDNQRV